MIDPITHDKRLASWRFWLIVVSLTALFFVVNGVSLVPPQQYQKLSLNPFITRTDIAEDNYWQETLLLPLIAFYSGLNSSLAFHVLCFLMLIAAYFLFAQLSALRFGAKAGLAFTAIVISSPLTTILLSWLGTPDGLTFLLTIPLLFTNSVPLIFVLSLLGVTNHVAFMIAAFEILILRWAANDRISHVQIFAQLLGGIVGYLLVRYFLHANQIHTMSRLDFILSRNFDSWLTVNSMNSQLTIFSFFHIHWLLILACSAFFFNKDRRFFLTLWGTLLINFGMTFFTLDQTRIFSLLSWGILLLCLFRSFVLSHNLSGPKTANQKTFVNGLAIISALAVLLPRYYSWEGRLFLAPFWNHLIKLIE